MFVPSESVYAEIHDGFDDVIQKAYRARVVLVSPSLLMLAIQVMQQILKDARMRDAADQIRTEVLNLGDDLGRLRERVLKLQKHFGDANEDVRQILISADKIEKRAGRIEELDFSKADAPAEAPRARQSRRARAVSRCRASCRRGSRHVRSDRRSRLTVSAVDRAGLIRADDRYRLDALPCSSCYRTESANTPP